MVNWTKVTNIVPLALILASFGIIAAIALAVAAGVTAPAIEAARQKSRNEVLLLLLPESVVNDPSVTSVEVGEVIYYGGFNTDGDLVGVVAKCYGTGYAGSIELFAGMTPDGTLINICSGTHNETPGLGSEVLERRLKRTITDPFPENTGLPANEVLDWYSGRNTADGKWKLEKDGGQAKFRTGATVTSRAVCDALWLAAEGYVKNCDKICTEMRRKNGEN